LAKVLIVDDDSQFRRVMRLALSAGGHEATEAANGREALDRMKVTIINVVLLDWQMPVMGGEETCRAIREISDVPILVVSAYDRSEVASLSGANASLTKPLDIDVLLGSIDSVLKHCGPR
jgi:CheY-like chemotaxis protein